MVLDQFSRGEKLTLGGAVVGAIGPFLPWAEGVLLGTTRSVSGIDAPGGWIVFCVFCVVAAVVLVADESRSRRYGISAVGLLTVGFAVAYVADPGAFVRVDEGTRALMTQKGFDPAVGIYLVLAGGVLVVGGAVADIVAARVAGAPTADGQRSDAETDSVHSE